VHEDDRERRRAGQPRAAERAQSARRADPDVTARVERERGRRVVGESIGARVGRPLAGSKERDTARRADPDAILGVHGEGAHARVRESIRCPIRAVRLAIVHRHPIVRTEPNPAIARDRQREDAATRES